MYRDLPQYAEKLRSKLFDFSVSDNDSIVKTHLQLAQISLPCATRLV